MIGSIFIEYLDAETIRFGYDSAGEVAFSQPVRVSYTQPTRIAFRHQPSALDGTRQGSIQVWVDQTSVWAAPLWSRPVDAPVWIPFSNPSFSASCRQLFTGVIHQKFNSAPVDRSDPDNIRLKINPPQGADTGTVTRQTLVTWTQDNGAEARLEIEPAGVAEAKLTWIDSHSTASVTVALRDNEATELQIIRVGTEIRLFAAQRFVLRHATAFLDGSPVRAWLGGKAAANGNQWIEFGAALPAKSALQSATDKTAGGVTLQVLLPRDKIGLGEPLVVTGPAGKADAAYIRYVSDNSVVLGFDHWGVGGAESPPITIDYDQLHTITVDFDSLHPDSTAPTGKIRIELDGTTVWEHEVRTHPHLVGSTTYGENTIGLSTAGPRFTGVILSTQISPR